MQELHCLSSTIRRSKVTGLLAELLTALSPEIADNAREFAAKEGLSEQEALEKGMKAKTGEFMEKGAKIYRKA